MHKRSSSWADCKYITKYKYIYTFCFWYETRKKNQPSTFGDRPLSYRLGVFH